MYLIIEICISQEFFHENSMQDGKIKEWIECQFFYCNVHNKLVLFLKMVEMQNHFDRFYACCV